MSETNWADERYDDLQHSLITNPKYWPRSEDCAGPKFFHALCDRDYCKCWCHEAEFSSKS